MIALLLCAIAFYIALFVGRNHHPMGIDVRVLGFSCFELSGEEKR